MDMLAYQPLHGKRPLQFTVSRCADRGLAAPGYLPSLQRLFTLVPFLQERMLRMQVSAAGGAESGQG